MIEKNFKKINEIIEDTKKELTKDEILLVLAGPTYPIVVDYIGFYNPDLLIFYGYCNKRKTVRILGPSSIDISIIVINKNKEQEEAS
jgi:hypothetical protein